MVKTKKAKKRQKMHVRQGDTVQVISGSDKKKVGQVIKVLAKTGKIIVENINIKTKHIRPKKEGETGQIQQIESPIHSSNVMLYSDTAKMISRYNIIIDEQNVKRKKLKKTGEILKYNGYE